MRIATAGLRIFWKFQELLPTPGLKSPTEDFDLCVMTMTVDRENCASLTSTDVGGAPAR